MKKSTQETTRVTNHFRERSSQRLSQEIDVILDNLNEGRVYKIGQGKRAIFFGRDSIVKNVVVIMSTRGELITIYHCDNPKKLKILRKGA